MTPQSTLIHAAELLEREATKLDIRRRRRGFWALDEDKYKHADLCQTAAKLREMAEKETV